MSHTVNQEVMMVIELIVQDLFLCVGNLVSQGLLHQLWVLFLKALQKMTYKLEMLYFVKVIMLPYLLAGVIVEKHTMLLWKNKELNGEQ
jgi:hypothetical protein